MSTRANINIEIKPEDHNKFMKFDKTLQYARGFCVVDGDYNYDSPLHGKKMIDPLERRKVKLNRRYLGIYTHWDGYPGGMGEILLQKYDKYNLALNLVLGGNISSLYHNYVEYGIDNLAEEKRKEYLEGCLAQKCDEPRYEEEYSYLLKADGDWYVRGHDIQEYTPLKEIIVDIILGKRDLYGDVIDKHSA